jgi:hypothetical protein
MRTAIGATAAVNIAKPANFSAPMIHTFLDNIRYSGRSSASVPTVYRFAD